LKKRQEAPNYVYSMVPCTVWF